MKTIKNIKIISFLSILWISAVSFWIYSLNVDAAPNCEYADKITKCVNANSLLSGNTPRSIEDFVCISSSSREKIAYNIVLDAKFKEIDKKVESYLESIEKNKDEYFGASASKTLFDGIGDLDTAFVNNSETWFYKQYENICDCKWSPVCSDNVIVKDTLACLKQSTILNASYFVSSNSGDNLCMDLAKTKLAIFRQIWTDLLKTNKQQIKNDYAKKYMQEQRTKYDSLIDKMQINWNYINKINNKWNIVTKDPNQQ